MGYEEVFKAYRVFDIEAGQMVISRDVNFDEASLGLTTKSPSEDLDDAVPDLDLLEISEDDVSQVNYKMTGKRKFRPRDNVARPSYRHNGLEESSAPDNVHDRHQRSRSRTS